MYKVRPVSRLLSSSASLTRCASPPDKVVADWPSFTYDKPTSSRVCNLRAMVGTACIKWNAASTVRSKIWAMLRPL